MDNQRLEFTDADGNPVAISVTEEIDYDYYVAPLYEHARYLLFYEAGENSLRSKNLVQRKLVAMNDQSETVTIKINGISAPLRNERDEYFSGWQYKDGEREVHTIPFYKEERTAR